MIGRYVMPYDIGLSGSWKVQSGYNYGRTMSVNLPVEGARTVRVEPITANRYPTVQIIDVRVDKSFELRHVFGKADPATRRVQPHQRRHGDHGPRDQYRRRAFQRSDGHPQPAGGPGWDSLRVLDDFSLAEFSGRHAHGASAPFFLIRNIPCRIPTPLALHCVPAEGLPSVRGSALFSRGWI